MQPYAGTGSVPSYYGRDDPLTRRSRESDVRHLCTRARHKAVSHTKNSTYTHTAQDDDSTEATCRAISTPGAATQLAWHSTDHPNLTLTPLTC